ncbi:hypothetical protein SAMN05443669_10081 [Flavobacterium xanthum]|uniref:Uncharacterized protein n=1 Tax=Flavobacterium xanthum TaxID=69322 RepID=A0A1M7AWI8_9FLAO|nr:hypothetical protein SAMN05443669_10081 [Flavobacterium xanthum]
MRIPDYCLIIVNILHLENQIDAFSEVYYLTFLLLFVPVHLLSFRSLNPLGNTAGLNHLNFHLHLFPNCNKGLQSNNLFLKLVLLIHVLQIPYHYPMYMLRPIRDATFLET